MTHKTARQIERVFKRLVNNGEEPDSAATAAAASKEFGRKVTAADVILASQIRARKRQCSKSTYTKQ